MDFFVFNAPRDDREISNDYRAPAPARHSTVGSGFVDAAAKGNADPALACSP
jgi:hypothetical protein